MKIKLAQADPLNRICDLLLLTLPNDSNLANTLDLGAAPPPGEYRMRPGGKSCARQVVLTRTNGATRDAVGDAAERTLRAASLADGVTVVCAPVPNPVEGLATTDSFRAQLEGYERVLSSGGLPLLQLIELITSDETRLAELQPVLDSFSFSARPVRRVAKEMRVRTTDQRAEASTDALVTARGLIDTGNPIGAYSEARQATEAGTATQDMNYVEVLALARMGDDARAIEQYKRYGLDKSTDTDTLALGARLRKDLALDSPTDVRPIRLWEAAELYREIYARTGGYFPLINAATLAAAAGRHDEARQRAEMVLGLPPIRIGGDYWSAVTKSEALLLLGRLREAQAAAEQAAALPDASIGARSSTVRQLERCFPLIQPEPSAYETVLAVLRPPPILHFCGHIFQTDLAAEIRLSGQIDAILDRLGVTSAYGALAAGADILIAERLLERGGELHVVLPFRQQDFVETSVAPAGTGWVERFQRCLSLASSVHMATEMPYVGDHRQFSYGTQVAMGLAVVRAGHQSTWAVQLAVWDGEDRGAPAGTAADVRFWAGTGRPTEVVSAGAILRANAARDEQQLSPEGPTVDRAAHALLFADFAGFSKIPEHLLPSFWSEVMTRAAKVIDDNEGIVLSRGTWGDAIYLVIDGALGAAELALSLQEALGAADLDCLACGPAGMRVALHHGPIYRSTDPITKREIFFGTEVSRTARLEPITPTGSVYVTEPFAALVALQDKGAFRLHNAGTLPLAKGYGTQPVYRLARGANRPAVT